MKPQALFYFLLLILIAVAGCKKHKTETPVDKLPPATQTGANTLGFLLNGEPWTPKGRVGITSNLSVSVDEGYKNGTFNITAYRILSDSNRSSIGLGLADSLNFLSIPVTVDLGKQSLFGLSFITSECTYDFFDTTVYKKGKLTLTKFDNVNRIISGMFMATFYKSNCGDTIKITNGRFDMKF